MAILTDGPVTPTDGTVFVRQIPLPANLVLNQLLPDRYSQATEVDFSVVTKRGNTARFRAHDAPAHMTPRDQLVTNKVPLIPLSGSKPVLGEAELARLYGLQNGNSPISPIAESIYDDLTNLTLDIQRRAEQARGAALSTGLFAINEGGMVGTIDYGIPSANKVTAPILWSNTASADIIGWFNSLRLQYILLNGYAPGGMVLSTTALTYIQQNAALRAMATQTIGGNQAGFGGLLPLNAVNAIFDTYRLPPITMVYDTRVDVDGTSTLVTPSNVVLLTPPADIELGYTQWGPTVTAQKLANTGNLTEEAPGIVGFVDRGDEFPYKQQTFADSLVLPAITNGNSLMILTVA